MDSQVKSIEALITDMVVPEARSSVNIIPDHITMLEGTKNQKALSRKRRSKKSKTLSRRRNAARGLFAMPTQQMSYKDGLLLHKLWKGYMREHLELREGSVVPQVHDLGYDNFCKQLTKMDLHGAKLRVIESNCPTLVDLSGIVVLETKNVLKMLGADNRLRTIPKSECIFGMTTGSVEFTIFGKSLAIRPADRSTKKIKNPIEPLKCS